MHLFRLPAAVRHLVPDCTWRMPSTDNTLYLTFDDGPIPEETPFVLETLARYGARGTFFCVGDNLVRHSDIARQTLAAGHRLANHTFHHVSGWTRSRAAYLGEVAECQAALNALLPAPEARPLMRPPYGRITIPLARALRPTHQVVMWDLLTCDYDRNFAAPDCLRASLHYTRPGSIVVFHDSRKASRNLRYVLPRYLDHFARQGFTFACL